MMVFKNYSFNIKMEPNNSFNFQIIIISLAFMVMVFQIWKKSSKASGVKLPPGPHRLPIIGNIHQLAAGFSLPHQKLRDLASKYGPIMHLQLGELSNIVISSPEFAKEILKTHDVNFSNRPSLLAGRILYEFRNIGLAPYGEYWRQMRKICILELLSAKQVKASKSVREKLVSDLVSAISSRAGSPINLTTLIESLTMHNTSATAFSNTGNHNEALLPLLAGLSKTLGGFSVADFFPSIKILQTITGIKQEVTKLRQGLDTVFGDIVNEHRARRNRGSETDEKGEFIEDLVDILLKYVDNNDSELKLSTTDLQAVITDMFTAGIETSSTLMGWAMTEMVKSPRVLKKAQAEVRKVCDGKQIVEESNLHLLEYLSLVIKETLRLHPPLPLLVPRENQERVEINGYEIPSKTKVIINAWAIGRDPRYWEEPEKFHPERFIDKSLDFKGTDCRYLPFGAGRRMCPGITYGMAIVELTLANLLFHFNWKLPREMRAEDLDMAETFGLTVRRKQELYVIPTPHNSLPQK